MRLVRLATATLLLAAPTLAQAADERHPLTPDPAAMARSIDGIKRAPGTYWPERQPDFNMVVAFGNEALGGVGQCGIPSDRASGRCRLRLAEGGPAVLDTDLPSTAVGVRFRWRF